jgi:uncharacterized protein YkwD
MSHKKTSRREDSRVIRFACPGCKSVLAGRDEDAGKIVICPKCGQRMRVPRQPREARLKPNWRGRRPLIAGIVLVGVLLLAGAGGVIWLRTHLADREPPPPSNTSHIPDVTVRERPPQPFADARGADKPPQPQPSSENRAATIRERTPPPLADARGSDKPPPVEEKKEVALANDLPPELPFDLVDAINFQRAKAGVEPIFLDAEVSRACQLRAENLARHPDWLPRGNRETECVAAEAPLAAIEKWLKEPNRRAAILEPRLRTFGAGFARNVDGQWFSVFDWTRGLDCGPPLEATPVTGAVVYPAPGQTRVSLWFPGNETPDPLPQTKDKLAGYPITLTFPPRTRIEAVTAHISNKEEGDIAVWLSSPEKPANPQFVGGQRNTICLIAKKPLRPNARYHVEVSAMVHGAAWSAKWDFATLSEGELHQELAGTFLRMLNRLRRSAGLPPVPLDAVRSKACAAHARYLSRNVPENPALNWNEEKADLPGYTKEGAVLARTASIQGGGGPGEAVAGLIDSLISRPQLLDPRLHDLGLGYTPFPMGGWIWVIDLHRRSGDATNKEYFYPAPDQENVPLVYPPNEVPSPIPASSQAERGNEARLAGYAITVLFGPRIRVTAATAKLADDNRAEVDGWFSTPEKPAIAGFLQRSLCFLPKTPLRPDTRYTATFQAEVNGKPWRRTWSFTTVKEPDRYSDDLEEKIVARVNATRKAAGLSLVRLDAELSRGCQLHAKYLARNHRRPEVQGMGMHRQYPDLPGASPEGARAAKGAVIAVVLDPQTCIENWMATLYHRIPILTPNLERIGFGHARIEGHKWVCVLDTGNGRAPQSRGR